MRHDLLDRRHTWYFLNTETYLIFSPQTQLSAQIWNYSTCGEICHACHVGSCSVERWCVRPETRSMFLCSFSLILHSSALFSWEMVCETGDWPNKTQSMFLCCFSLIYNIDVASHLSRLSYLVLLFTYLATRLLFALERIVLTGLPINLSVSPNPHTNPYTGSLHQILAPDPYTDQSSSWLDCP